MRYSVDAFDSHSICLLVAYLYQSRRLSLSANPLAVFQYVVNFFAENDLSNINLSFRSTELLPRGENHEEPSAPWSISLTHPLVGATSKDVMEFNCLWRISESAWRQLREEAKHSLQLLQSNGEGAFNEIFIQSKSFFQRYDVYFHVRVPDESPHTNGNGSAHSIHPVSARSMLAINKRLFRVAEQALGTGDRVQSLSTHLCLHPSNQHQDNTTQQRRTSSHLLTWNLVSPPVVEYPSSIAIGLVLNGINSIRRVDKGPEMAAAEDNAQESEFKRFWGPMCALRRFQDGTILEAVVWEVASTGALTSRARVVPKGEDLVEQILRFILSRHLSDIVGVDGSGLVSTETRLEKLLPGSDSILSSSSKLPRDGRLHFDAETLTSHAMQSFDKLRTLLTSQLPGIPLVIDSIQALCPSLRYSALYPPIPHPFIDGSKAALKAVSGQAISLQVEPLLIVATLESSGKWPSDPDAVAAMLTAFVLVLSTVLKKEYQIKSYPHRKWLDIVHDGYMYRMKLAVKGDKKTVDSNEGKKSSILYRVSDTNFLTFCFYVTFRSECRRQTQHRIDCSYE